MLCFECYPKKKRKKLWLGFRIHLYIWPSVTAGDKSHELKKNKEKSALMVVMNFCRFTLLTSCLQRDKNKLNNFKYIFQVWKNDHLKVCFDFWKPQQEIGIKKKSLQLKFSYEISNLLMRYITFSFWILYLKWFDNTAYLGADSFLKALIFIMIRKKKTSFKRWSVLMSSHYSNYVIRIQ